MPVSIGKCATAHAARTSRSVPPRLKVVKLYADALDGL
jgi:hypothetical protein